MGLRLLSIILFVFLVTSAVVHKHSAYAQEDPIEDEATVASDEKPAETPKADPTDGKALQDQGPEDAMPDGLPRPSPAAEAKLMFIDPPIGKLPRASGLKASIVPLEVPVGRPVNVVISFKHKGGIESKEGFYLDAVAGCLRYPMDFNYYIQNFTAHRLNDQHVEPLRHVTIDYSFTAAQQLMSRPYGLTLRVFYHDLAGQTYVQTVMNETVQLVEWDYSSTGAFIDTETVFLYVVILGLVTLLLVGVYQLVLAYGPKRKGSDRSKSARSSNNGAFPGDKKSKSSAGKEDADDSALQEAAALVSARGVDTDWIPKSILLQEANKRSADPQSPRLRKSRRTPQTIN